MEHFSRRRLKQDWFRGESTLELNNTTQTNIFFKDWMNKE